MRHNIISWVNLTTNIATDIVIYFIWGDIKANVDRHIDAECPSNTEVVEIRTGQSHNSANIQVQLHEFVTICNVSDDKVFVLKNLMLDPMPR